jgi:4-amino-4-deoxy-L-arabinose transferase-like glycosyltransferase
MKRDYTLFILILLIGVGLRSYLLFSNTQTNSDGVLYAWIGSNLADGYGYTIAEGTSLNDARQWHVPFFPIILASFYKVLGKGLFISKLPAYLFGIMTIAMIYVFCEKFFDRTTALIASFFLAVHPLFIFFSAEVMAESMYVFFLLLFLYLLLSLEESTVLKSHLNIGIIAGICYLTRTVGILTLPVYLLYQGYGNRKKFIERLTAFSGGFLLLSAPWWIWSHLKYGTTFSAEQNSLIQMYEFEFGFFEGQRLSLFSYLFGQHDPATVLFGFLNGISKLLKATFIPKILFFEGTNVARIFAVLPLMIIVFMLLFGIYAQIKGGRYENTLAFFGVIAFGLLGYAWGVHVIPSKSATIFRYTLPISLIFIIYVAVGIKGLLDKNTKFKALSFAFIFIIISSSLSITWANERLNRAWEDDFYINAVSDLPREAPVLASNPQRLRKLGFYEVYDLGDMDFSEMLNEVEQKRIRYIIVDTSSLYNDDQFYLVNNWYKERIPERFEKKSGDLFPITVYEIS